ncbi:hypothetical protein N7G274_001647 [Stereocaulon virgatum]|uniref:Uncharacterized protein n=1 Tax=Stereocaulon virgatum TaxID=373712 RepID=A0ABR4ALW1_9LECA
MLLWFLDAVADAVDDSTTISWLQVSRTDLIPLAATAEAAEKKTKAIHLLRNCCSVSEEHKSRDEQAYDLVEMSVRIWTAAAASTPEATARLLRSKTRGTVPLVPHRLL